MSGSDSGGGSGSGETGGAGGSGGRGVDCANLSFETLISSPNQSEVRKLKVGDILVIELDEDSRILQVVKDRNVIGGLVQDAPTLTHCIEQGHQYTATVREISGAKVTIFIQPI